MIFLAIIVVLLLIIAVQVSRRYRITGTREQVGKWRANDRADARLLILVILGIIAVVAALKDTWDALAP